MFWPCQMAQFRQKREAWSKEGKGRSQVNDPWSYPSSLFPPPLPSSPSFFFLLFSHPCRPFLSTLLRTCQAIQLISESQTSLPPSPPPSHYPFSLDTANVSNVMSFNLRASGYLVQAFACCLDDTRDAEESFLNLDGNADSNISVLIQAGVVNVRCNPREIWRVFTRVFSTGLMEWVEYVGDYCCNYLFRAM